VNYQAAVVGAGSNLNGPICRYARMPGPRIGALGRVDDRIDRASPPPISGGAPQARISEGSGGPGDMVCDSYQAEVVTDGDALDDG
jgi:hypothetical protein